MTRAEEILEFTEFGGDGNARAIVNLVGQAILDRVEIGSPECPGMIAAARVVDELYEELRRLSDLPPVVTVDILTALELEGVSR